jgi:hypothetical protein
MLEAEDFNDDFTDAEAIEAEIEILDEAYRNAYAVAVGNISIKQLISNSSEMIFLPFDPNNTETFFLIIDDIIEYFEQNQEYEKCAELITVKKKFDDVR